VVQVLVLVRDWAAQHILRRDEQQLRAGAWF